MRVLLNAIQQTVEEVVKTKQVCSHSKGYWTIELTEINKQFKKAKHIFQGQTAQTLKLLMT